MSQALQFDQADVVKGMVSLLVNGTPEDWNYHYRTKQFEQAAEQKASEAVVLEFEYADRNVLYQCVNDKFVRKAPIDYLEFGVASGVSMRHWVSINDKPESRFFGFDSFEGLPEDWMADSPKGTFTQHGNAPQVNDNRVQFVKGWFQDSVIPFLDTFTPRNKMVVHMDADLYSSTLYCLMNLDRYLPAGSIILFDEFTARNFSDECAALNDYCTACRRDYRFIAVRRDFVKVAVELTT